jgi:hypothetical protein
MRWLHTLLVAGALGTVSSAAELPPLTVEEIVARHVEARGGLEKLRALRSLRRDGHLVLPA